MRGIIGALGIAWLLVVAGCSASKPENDARHIPATAAKDKATAALTLLRAGDVDAALTSIDAAVAIDPDFGAAHLYRGFILSRQGKNEDAAAAFSRAVELDDYNCESPMFLGLAQEQLGDLETARSNYIRSAECFAAAADSAKPEHRVYAAVARYLHRGKLEGLQAISEVLTDFPDFAPAVRVRARFIEDDRKYFYRWASAPEL